MHPTLPVDTAPPRWKRVLLAVATVAPAAGLTVRNLVAPLGEVLGRVPDDAVFYLVIARNLWASAGVSFDGLEPTTGVHWLWLGVVALLTAAVAEPESGLRVLLLLHGLVAVATVLVFRRVLVLAGSAGPPGRVVSAAIGAWSASAYGLGMETLLAATIALAIVGVGLSTASPGFSERRLRSLAVVLGGALTLTRIDMLPLAIGAGRRMGWAIAGGLLGAAATQSLNHRIAGEWWSTSAALKGMGTVGERLLRLEAGVVWRHLPGPAVAAALVLVVAQAFPSGARPRFGLLTLAAAVAAVQLTASYLMNNLVGPWYMTPLPWLLVAAATAAAGGGTRGYLLAAILVVSQVRGLALPQPGLHATVLGFAQSVRRATPPTTRIVAEDFPGIVAWFSGRTVFAADGLAATPGYRGALVDGTAWRWWRDRGATHHAATRRREGWLESAPSVDAIAPKFLPVPASVVDLAGAEPVVHLVDPSSRRAFTLFRLPG